MKKIIPFIKELEFNNNIKDIISISLEHNLYINDNLILGDFMITGEYKTDDISITTKEFDFKIPVDITLDDKYNLDNVKIDIDNFYYEIVKDNTLMVHIDVLLDNLICIPEKKKEEIVVNEYDNIPLEREIVEAVDIDEENNNNNNNVINDIQSNFLDNKDCYITYKVHIMRDNDTIDSILASYNIEKEELEKYNDLNNITIGSKLIIPSNE